MADCLDQANLMRHLMMKSRLLTLEIAKGCGMGEGANCCIFLTVGSDGFQCEQRSDLADTLYRRAKSGTSNAKRTPESDFPSCQQEGRIAIEGPPPSFFDD